MKIEFTGSPLDYAKTLAPTELKKVIKAYKKESSDEFVGRCRICFENVLAGRMEVAAWWSHHAELVRPK